MKVTVIKGVSKKFSMGGKNKTESDRKTRPATEKTRPKSKTIKPPSTLSVLCM